MNAIIEYKTTSSVGKDILFRFAGLYNKVNEIFDWSLVNTSMQNNAI